MGLFLSLFWKIIGCESMAADDWFYIVDGRRREDLSGRNMRSSGLGWDLGDAR